MNMMRVTKDFSVVESEIEIGRAQVVLATNWDSNNTEEVLFYLFSTEYKQDPENKKRIRETSEVCISSGMRSQPIFNRISGWQVTAEELSARDLYRKTQEMKIVSNIPA